MSPTKRSDGNSESSHIANDEVQTTFDAFIAALFAGDYQTLGDLYDEDYAYMQSAGLVNDHLVECFRYRELMSEVAHAH